MNKRNKSNHVKIKINKISLTKPKRLRVLQLAKSNVIKQRIRLNKESKHNYFDSLDAKKGFKPFQNVYKPYFF